jgi:biotin transporter BioY
MLAILLGIPILGFLTMLQSVLVSRLPLLYGSADILLLTLLAWALNDRVKSAWLWTLFGGLMVSFLSALPNFTLLWAYIIAVAVARLLRHRIWQTPFLTMLLATFLGTMIVHGLTIFTLQIGGENLPLVTSFNLIFLPSALINIFLALPVFALVNDLANTLYPQELDV